MIDAKIDQLDLLSYQDKKEGRFIEVGPAIKLAMSVEEYDKLFASDDEWKAADKDSPHWTLSHEVAHYFQILGSSHGYLLYMAKRFRKRSYYRLFRRLTELKPDIKIERPCKEYFFGQNSIMHDPKGVLEHLIQDHQKRKDLLFFLFDYGCTDYISYLTNISHYLSLLIDEEFDDSYTDEFRLTEKELTPFLNNIFEYVKSDPNYINKHERHGGFITARSIVEGYARLVEFLTTNSLEVLEGLSYEEVSNHFEESLESYYGNAHLLIWSVLQDTQEATHKTLLFFFIFELSLMSHLHPCLIKGYDDPKPNELFITDRFLAILDYIEINRKKVENIISNFIKSESTNVFELLDRFCSELGWQKYSECINKLFKFSEYMLSKEGLFPSEKYFYLIQNKILYQKREDKSYLFANGKKMHQDAVLANMYVLIICNDGLRVTTNSAEHDPELPSKMLPHSFAEVLNDIMFLEIMESTNFDTTKEYLNVLFPDFPLNAYLEKNPYYKNIA